MLKKLPWQQWFTTLIKFYDSLNFWLTVLNLYRCTCTGIHQSEIIIYAWEWDWSLMSPCKWCIFNTLFKLSNIVKSSEECKLCKKQKRKFLGTRVKSATWWISYQHLKIHLSNCIFSEFSTCRYSTCITWLV